MDQLLVLCADRLRTREVAFLAQTNIFLGRHIVLKQLRSETARQAEKDRDKAEAEAEAAALPVEPPPFSQYDDYSPDSPYSADSDGNWHPTRTGFVPQFFPSTAHNFSHRNEHWD